jgi:hypothetical protein
VDTFEEAYCAEHSCDHRQFLNTVYRRCLYRHALACAFLFGGLNSDFFSADRELVESVGRVRNMEGMHEELHSYFSDARNHTFLRHRLKFRLCTQRLSRLAASSLRKARQQKAAK